MGATSQPDPGQPDPGSFRDPSSRVFIANGEVYRTLSDQGLRDFVATAKAPFFAPAIKAGRIIGTKVADPVPEGIPAAAQVLRHDRVPYVSYPYEWSFTMLRDAALLHLELVRDGLADGIITKDGSSYNVQWVGARPVFIDLGSFEPTRDGEPWFGYRQFCQLFLYPLLLQAHRNLPFQEWLRGSVDGISPDACRAAMRRSDLVRRGVFSHVYLQSRLEQKHADSDEVATDRLKQSGFSTDLIAANVDKLHRLISSLRWKQSNSEWSGYSDRQHYSGDDLDQKRSFVVDVAAQRQRSLVIDLGCNDGEFSRAVLPHADYVVAVDSDPLVVDLFYRTLHDEGEERILPLTMNLADPSPGIGWRGIERKPFLGRQPVDLVLALALVHHLSISNNVPLADVVAMFADLCTPGCDLVVEFPGPDDEKVKKLVRNKRAGVHDGYTRQNFESALAQHFTVMSTTLLAGGTRWMYHATSQA